MRYPYLLALLAPLSASASALRLPQDLQREILSYPEIARDIDYLDLDGDGFGDILVTGAELGEPIYRYLVFWGDGSGSFGPPVEVDLGTDASGFEVDDFDGDGDLDLLTIDRTTNQLLAIVNGGSRTDFNSVLIASPVGVPFFLTIADVDGDGDQDLFFRIDSSNGPLYRVERTGPGQFGSVESILPGTATTGAFGLGDVDQDGDLDLVGTTFNPTTIRYFENAGAAQFLNPVTLDSFPFGQAVTEVQLEDLDGDGDPEVLLASGPFSQEEFSLLRNTGGAFTTRESQVAVPESPREFFVRDGGSPGARDIITLLGDGQVLRIEDQGGGNYASAVPLIPGASSERGAVMVDVDGDGREDFLRVVSAVIGSALSMDVRLNRGNQSMGSAPTFGPDESLILVVASPTGVVAADFTGDGFADIAVAAEGGSTITLVENDGQGGFLGLRAIPTNIPSAVDIEEADIDGDGDRDIVAIGNSLMNWYENDGTGQVFTPRPLPAPAGFADGVLATDFDQDGDVDLFRSWHFPLNNRARVSYYQNLGAGNFAAPVLVVIIGADGYLGAMDCADLNGDGRLDFIYGANRFDTSRLAWFEQLPTGLLGPQQTIDQFTINPSLGPGYTDFFARDLDGDGAIDIVATSYGSPNRIVRFDNQGSGAFVGTDIDTLNDQQGCAQIEFADVNLDGFGDIIASVARPDLYGSELLLYPGSGTGQFGARMATGSGMGFASRLAPGDFDQDGDVDFTSVRFGRGRIATYLNDLVDPLGSSFCGPAATNSRGVTGRIVAAGSIALSDDEAFLRAWNLPRQQFGFFLASQTPDYVPIVPNSVGALCLGGAIGRLLGPGQVVSSGPDGVFQIPLDLGAIPQGVGTVPVLVGQAWNFQAWHRDVAAGVATSNFTDGVSVTWE